MKRPLLTSVLVLFAALLYAQPGGEYVVSNAREFVEAIGPQRTITLLPGEYDLSSVSNLSGEYFSFLDAYDGSELEISGVSGLIIRGSGKWDSHLITRPRYGHVIRFRGCQSISIRNIKAGHGPETGYCTGGVILFEGSQGISIEDCHLYGSGIEGLSLYRSQGIYVGNTIIKSCTYSLATLVQCQGVTFNRCSLFDTQEFDLINIDQCGSIDFKKCTFNRNRTSGNYLFFNVTQSNPVILKKCRFNGNKTGYFARKEGLLVLKGVRFNDNTWKGGSMYKE
jgi:hypothetical protein